MRWYIYKNNDDSIRITIHDVDHADGRANAWDADIWTLYDDGSVSASTYSDEAGDFFRTLLEAKELYASIYGPLQSISPTTVTDGW